jgi:hypothetical protein
MTEATDKQPLEQVVEPTVDNDVAAIEEIAAIKGIATADTGHQQQVDDRAGDDEPAQRQENPVFTDRARIAARFKAQREQRQEEIVNAAHADIFDAPADPSQDAARTIKVKVRHEIRELPEDEVIAAAQKTLAGDGYLEEARRLLEDAKQVASSRPHQGGSDPAYTNRQTDEADAQSHQTDDDRALAERLQFGSPDEAAAVIAQLRQAGTSAPDAVRRAVYDTQRATDVTRAKRSYDVFVRANEDLVKDPIAHAAMEAAFYNGLRQDLRTLGYTDDQLPRANERLVEAHRFHRIQGQDVRDTAALLEDSRQAVEKFRGAWSSEQPAPPARKDSVTVRVDRSERRAGIPLQPARSALPTSSSAAAQPVQNARKAAVQKMAASGRRLIST